MMSSTLFVALLLILPFVRPDRGPGLSIAASTQFFRNVTDMVFPVLVEEMRNYTLNTAGTLNLTFALMRYSLEAFRFDHVYINHTLTGIDFSSGRLVVSLHNMSVAFGGKFAVATEPELISGHGQASFNLSRFNMTLVLGFEVGANRLPNLRLYRSKLDLNNQSLTMKITGDDEIFETINSIQEKILRILREAIEGEMSDFTKAKVQDAVNRAMNATSTFVYISPESDLGIDYQLISPPEVKQNNYLPFAFNGTGVCDNKEECRPFKGERPSPPGEVNVFDGSSGLQMMVSDYLINTFFIAGFEGTLFNMTVRPETFEKITNGRLKLDTDLIGVFIPEIRKHYGPQKNVTLRFNSTAPPKMDVKASGISLNADCEAEIMVSEGKGTLMRALKVQLHFDAKVEASVAKNVLRGNITEYTFYLKNLESEIKGLQIDDVERFLQMLLKLLVPQLNSNLKDGIPLPPLRPFFSLRQSKVSLLDRYIRVDLIPAPMRIRELIRKFALTP